MAIEWQGTRHHSMSYLDISSGSSTGDTTILSLATYVPEKGPKGPIGPHDAPRPNSWCLLGLFCGPFFVADIRKGPRKGPIDLHATVVLGLLGRLGPFLAYKSLKM